MSDPIYNRTRSKAEQLAAQFGIPNVYDDPDELLAHKVLDFVDIVTDVDSHPQFALPAAERGLSAICQKPLGPTLSLARQMAHVHRRDASARVRRLRVRPHEQRSAFR